MSGELIPAPSVLDGPVLWCVHCQAKHVTRSRPMGNVKLYRCGSCGYWVRCATCLAVSSILHECPL